ncbi:NAD(P)/FAD-dependent oxidoreductase [Bacteroidota bacterium]
MPNIVIIGNGISGITCARHVRKNSTDPITIISAETNHFFSRTALMYIYMGHMSYEHTKPYEDWFWTKNNLQLVRGYVEGIDENSKTLSLKDQDDIKYDVLVIAAGSKPNKLGWPGQDVRGIQGLYSYQDLETMERNTKDIQKAVIVGGGLIGIEMAEMLLSRNIPVTFLVRENQYWDNVLPKEEATMISQHIREHQIDLRLGTELKEIVSDGNDVVSTIITDKDERIECQFVGLTAGVTPNIDFLKNSNIETERGVLINRYFETNIRDVYAVGDCAEFRDTIQDRNSIEQVWYTGRMHGETLARTLLGNKTEYIPGPWFNSAKFLDIEYQVYGQVSNVPKDIEEHIYWEHPDGKKSIRIIYNKSDKSIVGLNLMGIRFNHEVCDQWLKQKASIDHVLGNLDEANFDPEFYNTNHNEVIKIYNLNNPGNEIKLKTRGKKQFGAISF